MLNAQRDLGMLVLTPIIIGALIFTVAKMLYESVVMEGRQHYRC